MSFLVRQLKVKNSIANQFSYFASLRIFLSIAQKGGKRKKTAKRLLWQTWQGCILLILRVLLWSLLNITVAGL